MGDHHVELAGKDTPIEVVGGLYVDARGIMVNGETSDPHPVGVGAR